MQSNKYNIHCRCVYMDRLNASENGRGVASASVQQVRAYARRRALFAASHISVDRSSRFCAIASDSSMAATDTAYFSGSPEYRFDANSYSYLLHGHTLLKRVEAAAFDIDAVTALVSQNAECFLGLEVSL